MFSKIFLFEIDYKLRRPAVYVYFLMGFVFTALSFAKGAMPLDENQWINSTSALAFFTSIMSLMVMVVSSSVMGLPLIRDIEFNTKEYYLSYPITKAGYFWGRFISSFIFVLIMSSSVQLGAYAGTYLGPLFGWTPAAHYGPNIFWHYLHPFITIAVPNLFFASALFFGLVAATKNVKVIYTSGALLFLGYLFANFLIHAAGSQRVIYLSDPFLISAIRYERGLSTTVQKNSAVLPMQGLLLWNRILWISIGLLILVWTYIRFSFEKFFAGKANTKKIKTAPKTFILPNFSVAYEKNYLRKTLLTLTRIEIQNIVRDAYFWIIIGAGSFFMLMVFYHLWGRFNVPDFPLTTMILQAFNSNFPLFIFCIIAFYAGETVHRERITRYSAINDALPPPVYIFNLTKFISLLAIAIFMAITPMLLGIAVQLSKGFTALNITLYVEVISLTVIPNCIEMVIFAFALHILINNKFAVLGIVIALWVLFTLADASGWMNYHLLLYGQTPSFGISGMDGIGHMLKAINWFNLYWLLFGGILTLVAYLFYVRGNFFSLKERLKIARERFSGKTRLIAGLIVIAFLVVATYNYYNVSYLNSYYTVGETTDRAALTEKKLKHFDSMMLPTVIRMKMQVDLYPEEQKMQAHCELSLINKNAAAVTQLLLDGDNIDDYMLTYAGKTLTYSNPLLFKRGKFNFLQPPADSSSYRLYQLPKPLLPGDTMLLGVSSQKKYNGFANSMYGSDLLHNGIAVGAGLPDLGYDDEEELTDRDERATHGLPVKEDDFSDVKDSTGINRPITGIQTGFMQFDITVSTTGDQFVVGPGNLVKQWKRDGRNFFEYVSNDKGIYSGIGFTSARYTSATSNAKAGNGQQVKVNVYYDPASSVNINRFVAGFKAGLQYYTTNWAPYNFDAVTLAETPLYNRLINTMAATNLFSENMGWNANFVEVSQWDYCYFLATQQLAKQWWLSSIIPSHTKGSQVIAGGVAKYAALLMMEKKYGLHNINNIISNELDEYFWRRGRTVRNQYPIVNSNNGTVFDNKAGVLLYGLKNLVGEDSINAALREFYQKYAFKATAPYAGSKDLYDCLQRHIPDSMKYYLHDSWEKVTFYENAIVAATVTHLHGHDYKIQVKINVAKTYEDENGNTSPAIINDYVEIGVFGDNHKAKEGYPYQHILYLNTYKLTSGEHTLELVVPGKPARVAVDPFIMLIDKNRNDNWKGL